MGYVSYVKLEVREFLTPAGRSPFRDWLDALDRAVRARVQARVLRFELGNLGDHKPVGGGVLEARLAHGPGYRIYFGLHEQRIVLLLVGGDKKSQAGDIRQARKYWTDFMEAASHGKAQ